MSHNAVQFTMSQLRDYADRFDALGIDGSHQLRDFADALSVGKVSHSRAMSLLCRASADIYHHNQIGV